MRSRYALRRVDTVNQPLQAGVAITVKLSKRKPRIIVIPSKLLAMLSERTRRIVLDEALDGNHRFKELIEKLHWDKKVSVEVHLFINPFRELQSRSVSSSEVLKC